MRYIGYSILFLLLSQPLWSQSRLSTSNKRAIKFYQEGELLIRQRSFNDAIANFHKAVDKDSDFYEAHLRLAYCYELMRDQKAQLTHLEEVSRIMPGNPKVKNVYFSLAKAYLGQGKYALAEKNLKIFSGFGVNEPRLIAETEQIRRSVEFANEQLKNPIQIDPQPLPDVINTFPLQYFPALTADEQTIFFTRRMGNSFHDSEDIFYSTKNDAGEWQRPASVSPNINSQFNEGTCAVSADGRTLIFTTCEGRKGYGSCDLFMSTYEDGDWTVPVNLGANVNSRYWDSQPSLSADGSALYFVSDRPGGVGKRDLWMTEIDENGEWKPAWNLGSNINTTEDEVSPFIHVNGFTLYFASRGHVGMGGFDLFFAERESDAWTKPENLGYPINNHDDQVSLVVSTDGLRGYYSYETESGSANNRSLLYSFEFPPERRIALRSNYLRGTVFDLETRKPIGATIELIDLEKDQSINKFKSDRKTGEYYSIVTEGKNYSLYVESPGYLFESRSFNLENIAPEEPLVQDFYLRPLKKGSITQLNNIFFETNAYKLTTDSKTELNKVVQLMRENPTIKIEISGHTDDVGTDVFNLELSDKRAEAVRDFLVDKNIETSRIQHKGYGKSRPILPNTTEENRGKNRRIEFEILE
ncbi:MAG: OmpA family protein [Cyclobacteriaceae bacterium]